MNLWRTFEFRGRDPNDNPFVDFGFVEVEEERLALSSHMLPRAAVGRQRVSGDTNLQTLLRSARLLEAAIQGPLAGWGACRRPL